MARVNPYGLKVELNTEAQTVDVLVRKREGEGFTDVEQKSFPLAEVHESLVLNVSLYGLSKLLQDRTSQVDAGPGKLAEMTNVLSLLASGEWEKERVSGAPAVSPEVEALAEIKGVSVGVIQKALKNYTPEQREKVLAHPKVTELAAKIRAARDEAVAEVDLSDMTV